MLKFEFHIISTCNTLLFLYFNFLNVKITLSSWAMQTGWNWFTGVDLPAPPDLEH